MSLNLSRVEKVVELGDGMKRGRCPACAESGGDRKGQHLRIYPDGKFGCCVHPADNEHRKRIFALVGEHKPKGIVVRVAPVTAPQIRRGILKSVAVAQPTCDLPPGSPDAPDGANEMQNAECGVRNENQEGRTGRTLEQKSNDTSMETENQQRTGRTGQPDWTGELFTEVRTLRTPQYSLRGTTADNKESENDVYILKGFADPVRCVRVSATPAIAEPVPTKAGEKRQRLPYLTRDGTLGIPFDSPERYHWWKPPHDQRLRVSEIVAEVRERKENDASGF